ncbi:MAG: helix-turn-helix domain-containing protein [Nostoc sp.]|uniref:helix-turn-helix domain-containing protein n=1 Tax=Nostoc sp. TaxID=1180 RepID=UPI002FF21CFC
MQGPISSIRVEMTGKQQDVLNSWLRKSTTPLGLAKRARAILMLASGETFSKTSQYVDIGERHLRKWARRFIDTLRVSSKIDSAIKAICWVNWDIDAENFSV